VILFFRVLSIVLMFASFGLLFRVGPLGQFDYQSLGYMHIGVIIIFYASFSWFKKDLKLIARYYELRKTMEGVVKKAGSTFTQTTVVFVVFLVWILPLLLTGLWWGAGKLELDVTSTAVPLLWFVLSLCAGLYLCLLNPLIRKKYK